MDLLPTLVVCAAIRNKITGEIVCGARHFDAIMRSRTMKDGVREPGWTEQGFIDQRCNFLTREEAWKVALANNQIRRRCGGDEGVLYSENLY